MSDRVTRDELAGMLKRYLADEITAFELDKAALDIAFRTEDRTAGIVAVELSDCCDEFINHKIVASKEAWDYLHRLLLLLESDAEIEETRETVWSVRQAIALCLVVFSVSFLVHFGIGYHLLAAVVPLGVVSMLLSYWRYRPVRQRLRKGAALMPFSSVGQLLSVRRRVRGFDKKKYPAHLRDRRVRDPLLEAILHIRYRALWLLFSPLVLLAQTFPERNYVWHVADVQEGGGGVDDGRSTEAASEPEQGPKQDD